MPEQVDAVFKKMIAKKVEDRYQTMTEVITALDHCVRSQEQMVKTQRSLGTSTDTFDLDLKTLFKDVSLEQTEPIRTQKPSRPPIDKGMKKTLLIGGAVLGVMILLAGVVINMRTNGGDGTLVVTVSEPDAQVQVLNEKDAVEITRKGDKGPITITVVQGKHRLKVQKDGFEIFTDSFEIKSGNTEAIKAELVPLEKPAVASGKSWEIACLPAMDERRGRPACREAGGSRQQEADGIESGV